MNKILHIIGLFLLPIVIFAQSFTTNAPERVAMGEPFRVQYILNSTDGENFDCVIPAEFELNGGPSESRSSSFSMVNGRTSSSSTTTYTYVLTAKKTGVLILPVATVRVKGKGLRATPRKITVGGASRTQSPTPSAAISSGKPQKMTDKDIFIRAVTSRTKIYEQEPITVVYKLYFRYGVADFRSYRVVKKPEFKGFWTQEMELPQEPQMSFETIGGSHYAVFTLYKLLAYPQQSGEVVIPGLQAECQFLVANPTMDIEDFFGGNLQAYTKQVSCADQKVSISPLPSPKPTDFSGGVGTFTVKGEITTPGQLTSNDIAVYRLTVSGNGNLNMIQAPKINFPKNFDVYEPKMTDESTVESTGKTGSVHFDYTFVPREQGEYTVPPTNFTYFDTETHTYKTLTIPEQKLVIAKGTRTAEDVANEMALRNSDIADIHEGNDSDFNFGWTLYLLVLAGILVISGMALPMVEKYAKNRSDIGFSRRKKALRTATKRLEEAKKTGDTRQFYSQLSAALCGFIADRLNCPVTEISAQTVEDKLSSQDIDTEALTQLKTLLEDCEFAQFAPTNPEASQQALTKAENLLKNLKL